MTDKESLEEELRLHRDRRKRLSSELADCLGAIELLLAQLGGGASPEKKKLKPSKVVREVFRQNGNKPLSEEQIKNGVLQIMLLRLLTPDKPVDFIDESNAERCITQMENAGSLVRNKDGLLEYVEKGLD
jgi:hypothetical protein